MIRDSDVLIVGTGHGGAQTAIALRQAGFAGSITLVGEEPDLPYERPPLSKDYLSGDRRFARMLIRPSEFWSERAITILPGHRIVKVHVDAHEVEDAERQRFGYRHLVWAAGGHARRLTCAGAGLRGVHCVRTRADVDAMRDEMSSVETVVVVGGGYIGLETAAVLTKLGKTVIVLEALDRVLARVAGETLSRFYENEHRAKGVDVRLNVAVAGVEGQAGRASGVRLQTGEVIAADMVIVGIGIVPMVEPVLAAGADGGNGVAIDAFGRTTLADVFAVGDCALHANPYSGDAPIRLESVQNASDLATTVARTITGRPEPYRAVPWFWSHQYDLRLQTVGLSLGHDETVVRGALATRSFSIIYLRQGRVIALDCVNAARDFVQGKGLVADQAVVDGAALADAGLPLKQLGPHVDGRSGEAPAAQIRQGLVAVSGLG